MHPSIPAPAPGEYAPFYAPYLAALPAQPGLVWLLERQVEHLNAACALLSEEEALARYAPGKWSVKEVIGHLIDAERIFAYRLLRIVRGDRTLLAGFDENAYVEAAGFDARPLGDLLAEFEHVRAATLALVQSVAPEAWTRHGNANGVEVSARALAYIIAGHAQHHLGVLHTRYGLNVPPG